jgi:hypothetical protein
MIGSAAGIPDHQLGIASGAGRQASLSAAYSRVARLCVRSISLQAATVGFRASPSHFTGSQSAAVDGWTLNRMPDQTKAAPSPALGNRVNQRHRSNDVRGLAGILPRGKDQCVGIYRFFHRRGAEIRTKQGEYCTFIVIFYRHFFRPLRFCGKNLAYFDR